MLGKNDPNIPILVEVPRSTFQSIEQSEDLPPNDPALREIKNSILRTMANRRMDPAKEKDPAA